MKILRSLLVAASTVVLLAVASSCTSRDEFVYLNDMRPGMFYPADFKHEAVIHCDDRLAIAVTCKNPELALPFNLPGGNFSVGADGTVTSSTTTTETTSGNKGYRVDVSGNIDFPLLGKLHVEGMTLNAAKELITQKIIEGNYIKQPLVTIEFLNFKYTVLGAVGNAGTYTVTGDRISLIDAIARAGDLNSKARLDRIVVIREDGGDRKEYVHDIRTKDIFDSPAYYLQQNDIVYVEPKYNKKDRADKGWQISSLIISLAGLACSAIWAFK